MSNPCEEEVVFFDTEDQLTDKEEIVGSSQHDIWLSEPQSITVRRGTFLSRMGFLGQLEPHEVESSRITESTEAESNYSEPSSSSGRFYESLLYERRESNSESNCSVYYSYKDWSHYASIADMQMETLENVEEKSEVKRSRRKHNNVVNIWKQITRRLKEKTGHNSRKEAKSPGAMARVRVEKNQKRCMELTGLFSGQELKAHSGLILTMKFSPDGKYLASGGEDGVVCVWRVRSKDASCTTESCILGSRDDEKEYSRTKMKYNHASIVVPDKIFHIEEDPVHKFNGHSSNVLDLAWSSSNYLLSSSMDMTVRLWKVGSDQCLRVFQHVDYVTCVQFNPVDENYFVSGSIDGKVRIWGIRKGRVEHWANARDIVTALCYQQNGKGFLVGSVSGICRFYDLSAGELVLNAEVKVHRRKKSYGNRIASIQFLASDSQRVMITSDDSKVYVLEGFEVVSKYKGLAKSGAQISASDGKHIISVGEDSRVHLYNHDDSRIRSSKRVKTVSSFEHFLTEGATTVALPWSDSDTTARDYGIPCDESPLTSERFSLASWFSMDGSCRGSLTWPEEKLPPIQQDCDQLGYCHHQRQVMNGQNCMPPTWGLVFVTAHRDGSIRTFHNYGLPVVRT